MRDSAVGALTRRGSLLTLATTAMHASRSRLASADVALSSKKTKKLKTKKCKKQVGQCSAFLEEVCLGNPVCESAIPCCGLLATCNASDALTCVFTV
jgi:hypothetical protein